MIREEMILANINGTATVYYGSTGWELFHRDTFNPNTEYSFIVLGAIKGKTYKERKADAESKAIDFSYFDTSGLSWGEYADIGSYFENIGKRYGLLRDFHENAIC